MYLDNPLINIKKIWVGPLNKFFIGKMFCLSAKHLLIQSTAYLPKITPGAQSPAVPAPQNRSMKHCLKMCLSGSVENSERFLKRQRPRVFR